MLCVLVSGADSLIPMLVLLHLIEEALELPRFRQPSTQPDRLQVRAEGWLAIGLEELGRQVVLELS